MPDTYAHQPGMEWRKHIVGAGVGVSDTRRLGNTMKRAEASARVADAKYTHRSGSTLQEVPLKTTMQNPTCVPFARTLPTPPITCNIMPGIGGLNEGYGLGGAVHSMHKPNAPRDFFSDKAAGEDPLRTQR